MIFLQIIFLLILLLIILNYWKIKTYRHILEQELKMSQALTEIESIAVQGIQKGIFLDMHTIYKSMYFIQKERRYKIHFKDTLNKEVEDYLKDIDSFKRLIDQIETGASKHVCTFFNALSKSIMIKNPFKYLFILINVACKLLFAKEENKGEKIARISSETKKKNIKKLFSSDEFDDFKNHKIA